MPAERNLRRRTEAGPSASTRQQQDQQRPSLRHQRPSQRIEIDSDEMVPTNGGDGDDDDEVQFRFARRIRGIDNGVLVNERAQQEARPSPPRPARPVRPRDFTEFPNAMQRHMQRHNPHATHFFAMNPETGALRILHGSMPPNRMMGVGGLGLEGVDARIRQRYHQLDIPLHQIGFGGVYHPHFLQPVKLTYSAKASHPRKWPGYSSNAGPNIRSRRLLDAASNRQLAIHGDGDKALYALRCGHVVDGKTYDNLVNSHLLPKKRKSSKTKYCFGCPVPSCKAEHTQEPGMDAIRLWS